MTRNIDLSLLAKSGASLIAIAVACSSTAAFAQTPAVTGGATQDNAPSPPGSAVENTATAPDAETIVVVGTRQSQQSAINRKKRARTATDSIVADDIGSFPDRNVSEAMSRIPGVALSRNDFGEGEGVSVRGNGMDLTRVELDGIGVQSTNALAISSEGGRARTADLRELPAELVKSIDVVKGSTADMTEGSLGGGVQITTRSGLDFRKPFFQIRAGVQRNSLGRKITPEGSIIGASRFFEDRLGVIVSGTYNHIQTDSHGMENVTSNARNYATLIDFDQSPDKTFTFNPGTVGGDEADIAFANSLQADGTPLTPRELVTLAAGATSKAQCFTIFPHNPTGNAPGTPAATQTAQRNQRILEQQTCLNQWNDYTPSLIRHFMNTQEDKRIGLDARVDFKVTDNLTVFGKVSQLNRKTDDLNRGRNPISLLDGNPVGSFTDITTAGYPRQRTVAATARPGYYLWDPNFGLNSQGGFATLGNVVNVVPGSVTVDENHNVTQMTLTNNTVSIDQISNTNDTKTRYAQVGAQYRGSRIDVDAMGGMTKASSSRGDMRTSRSSFYGDATLTLQPGGLWGIEQPAGYDETNIANFVQIDAPGCPVGTLPANCQSLIPMTSPNDQRRGFSASWSPAIAETAEKIGKLDFTWRTDGIVPFFNRFKTGIQLRKNDLDRYGGGNYTVSSAVGTPGQPGFVPAVVIPRSIGRGFFRACEQTARSAPCSYGFVPSADPNTAREGIEVLPQQQIIDLFTRHLQPAESTFFGGYPGNIDFPEAWASIDTRGLFKELGSYQFMNFDCLKRCTASDGQVYDAAVQRIGETVKNVYAMADFELKLPLGTRFDGNVGVRGIRVDVASSALLTFNSIRVTPAFNPLFPDLPAGMITQSFSQNSTLKSKTTDWLPTANFNLWGFDDKVVLRAYGGKTVARPPLDRMIPGGTCTIDERDTLDGDEENFRCTGRVGNPGLKPFTAQNRNLSLEWYPNSDTNFSIAYHKLNVSIGAPIAVSRDARIFAGSSEIDPGTGLPLSDFIFTYPTWENGPGYKRSGWEFGAKSAFTFLPYFFRHLGADANISLLKSSATTGLRDPATGDIMAPPNEQRRYTNLSLWYDDGRLNLRVAMQDRTAQFTCITPCGGNNTDFNYPGEGYTNVRLVSTAPLGGGYRPGVPRFIDGNRFIDAKASYNVNRYLQVYFEGRNLTKQGQTYSSGKYVPFGDGSPKIHRLSYGGRRFMGGARVQFGGNSK